MRNTITAIVVLLIVLAAIMAFTKGDEAPEMTSGEMMHEATTVSGTYVLDTEASAVEWIGSKKILATYIDTGSIELSGGSLTLEEGTVTGGGDFVVDMTTIAAETTGSGGGQTNLVRHLKSDDFFNVEEYPEATLSFEGIELVGTTTYKATAMLTIKDVTRRILFPFEVFSLEDEKVGAEATIDVDRTKWDITFGSDGFFDDLGDNVIDDIFTLNLNLVFEEGKEMMDDKEEMDDDEEKMDEEEESDSDEE